MLEIVAIRLDYSRTIGCAEYITVNRELRWEYMLLGLTDRVV